MQPGWSCNELKPQSRRKQFVASALLHVLFLPLIFWIAALVTLITGWQYWDQTRKALAG